MKSTLLSLVSCLFILVELSSVHAMPMNNPPHTGTTTPSTAAAGAAGKAAPIKPEKDLSTYISKSLKGTGSKTLEAEVPVDARPFIKATAASVKAFDDEINKYVAEEVKAEEALKARVGSGFSIGTPELKFTDQILKLSLKHNVGFMAPCKDEKKTGGDLICAMHIEHVLPGGKVKKIFAIVQIKVATRYKNLTPTVDFTHTNSNGLQLELLAKEAIHKRAELAPDVDVVAFYAATLHNELMTMPINDILEHYKGPMVDASAPFSRTVTDDLTKKYGGEKGFLQGIIDYVEHHDK